ncbi:penicillin-binding transpeptidase domain-containing protein [Thermodesulfobacteriota bacterium]
MKKGHPSNWRDYQNELKRKRRGKKLVNKLPMFAVCAVFALGGMWVVIFWGVWFDGFSSKAGLNPDNRDKRQDRLKETVEVPDFSNFLETQGLNTAQLTEKFYLKSGGTRYEIKSTIEQNLQNYVIWLLKRSMTRQAAVVALDPSDGRILALATYSDTGESDNICVEAEYPAASLFKIVSAAAAIEKTGFNPDRSVFYSGSKYTLYKSQLKNMRKGRYVSQTTFKNAFATSINSVFGKLGINSLGQQTMKEYADKFLFNSKIPFDIDVAESVAWVPEDEYGLAEAACGFNKNTLISPLHAALLAASVANNGILMAPRLVETISSESGEVLFMSRPFMLAAPIRPGTAKKMKIMMRETTLYGTCRNFRKLRRKKAFKNVDMGAKTGTINDKGDQFKYDWLTTYGLSDNGKSICIAVLGIHGERLGIRANELGKMIINYYFSS